MLALLALFALSRSGTSSKPDALERPKVQTGGTDPNEWARTRFEMLRLTLATLSQSLSAADIRRVSLSILAQYAHETARGRNEFDFNLGGWNAAAGEPFFRAAGAADPGRPVFKFAAFDDLASAVRIQLERLRARFPSAVRLLVADPESSDWVEELGRRGYYTAKISDYARAWAMHRAELGTLLAGVA